MPRSRNRWSSAKRRPELHQSRRAVLPRKSRIDRASRRRQVRIAAVFAKSRNQSGRYQQDDWAASIHDDTQLKWLVFQLLLIEL